MSDQPEETEVKHYREGSWKGFTQHLCNYCPWDTLQGEAAMLAHLQAQHFPPKPEPTPSRILVADRRGKEQSPQREDANPKREV